MARKNLYAGVDIGGTKISVVITNGRGEIIGRSRKKSKPDKGFAVVMERTAGAVGEALAACGGLSSKDIAVLGVGAPSPILPDGTAVQAANMGWKRAPLVKTLHKMLGCPVFAENDCNAGAYGEYRLGAGKGAKLLIGLFVGTGLGGGLVMDGRIISGVNMMGGEFGHMTIKSGGRPCGCGKRGCIEAYTSKIGMGYRFRHEILCEQRPSLLKDLCKDDYSNIRSSVLRQAWLAGDAVTVETLTESAEYLGEAISSFITLLAPDVVVVGGGVYQALSHQLMPIVRRRVRETCYPAASLRDTRIVTAALGDDAVALGALEYAKFRLAQA